MQGDHVVSCEARNCERIGQVVFACFWLFASAAEGPSNLFLESFR